MSEAPKLPSHVSSDGREIWDWAAKLSAHTQRVHKLRQLQADIASIGKRCGDCDKWMKSRECPAEKNVNGFSRGPSCNGFICKAFVECRYATARREELRAELASLESSK
jgi:hypothetical protein